MLAALAADKQTLIKNQTKRKLEDDRLKMLNLVALNHQESIEKLNNSIAKKQAMLAKRKQDLAKLK